MGDVKQDIRNLERWRDDGTLDRLAQALETRRLVQIKRTSGAMVTGIIGGWSHGGLSLVVAWVSDPTAEPDECTAILGGVVWDVGGDRVHFPQGVSGKRVLTEEILTWNPDLAAAPNAGKAAK